MQELSINEIRAIQLAILNDFTGFCEAHDLTYALCGGTLLGAVRHQGYIPWDDDIDIMMARPDFERLLRIYRSDEYQLFYYTTKDYPLPFVKIGDRNTITKGRAFNGFNIGVHIDVLPIDAFPDTPLRIKTHQIKIRLFRALLNTRYYARGVDESLYKALFFTVCSYISRLFPAKMIVAGLIKTCKRYAFDKCSHAGNLIWGYRMKEYHPKQVFTEQIRLPFEGNTYYGPKDYDTYLSNLFGEYMKLPPESERQMTHPEKFYWKMPGRKNG